MEKINKIITEMATRSLRTLCLGYRKVDERDLNDDVNKKDDKGIYKVEKENIILLAVLGVRDNPRQ
jgi:P-type Ca2+ transporter type 2B